MSVSLSALEARHAAGDPIRVGLVGAGFAGRGFALAAITGHPGPPGRCASPTGRSRRPSAPTGTPASTTVERVSTRRRAGPGDRGGAARRDRRSEPRDRGRSRRRDRRGDRRGRVRRRHVAFGAIDNGKHLVLINAELDSTLGPILQDTGRRGRRRPDRHGGRPAGRAHEPLRRGPAARLPADPRRQHQEPARPPPDARDADARFAEAVFQRPKMITSFADGTKIAAEMAVVANATGFGVATRGMLGPKAARVEEAPGAVRHRLAPRAADRRLHHRRRAELRGLRPRLRRRPISSSAT